MKTIKNVLLAGLFLAPTAAAQTAVTAGPSTEPWLGFMNVFELDCVNFAFNGVWGVPDLESSFDDVGGTITMTAAPIVTNDNFWYTGMGTMPGGPGVPGNKCMDATLYQELTDSLNGQTVTFAGTVQSNTLAMGYTSELFIRDWNFDFTQFNENSIAVVPGPFSFDLTTDPALGRTVQWGLQIIGPNVWPGDQALAGSVVLGQGFPDGAFDSFCNGDGGNQMGCTNCPCGNNAPAGTLGGCLHSAGMSGLLVGSGSPNVSSDSMRFEMNSAVPSSFAVLSSGAGQAPGNSMNPCFGLNTGILSPAFDGLRCVVQDFQRHGARPIDANGDVGVTTNGWGPPNGPAGGLIAANGFVAGQTRHFQAIFRDDATMACGTGLNTSQGVSVTMQP